MVASVEVVDGKRCAIGLVGVFTVDIDEALTRLGGNFDVSLGNLGAVVECVTLVIARPNVHALVHELVTLVDNDESLATRCDGSLFDRAVAEEFATEINFAVRRICDDGDCCWLATWWWIVVSDGCRKKESHHKGEDIEFFHGCTPILFVQNLLSKLNLILFS